MPVPRSSLIPLLLLAAACQPGKAGQSSAGKGGEIPQAGRSQESGQARPGAPTPLDGLWRQASIACPDGRKPAEKVEELDFGSAGFFSVTYSPFETYKDYWGKARFDLAKGDIAFTIEHGNFIAPGLDLEGKVKLEGDRLTISEVWFGDRASSAGPAGGCTYVFARPWAR